MPAPLDEIRRLQDHAAQSFEVFLLSYPDLGGDVSRRHGAVAFRWPAVPIELFNHIHALGDERLPTKAEIDDLLALYREHELPCYVQLSPLADQVRLGEMLTACGLEQRTPWAVMALHKDAWKRFELPPSVSVEPVNALNRHDFVRVAMEAFQMPDHVYPAIEATLDQPDTYHFLATYDGEPAGTGQLYVRAGIGGLYTGSVLERFRRRGLHSALITRRVEAAFDLGLDLLFSETEELGNQSANDLTRRGFFLAYEHVNWGLPRELNSTFGSLPTLSVPSRDEWDARG